MLSDGRLDDLNRETCMRHGEVCSVVEVLLPFLGVVEDGGARELASLERAYAVRQQPSDTVALSCEFWRWSSLCLSPRSFR